MTKYDCPIGPTGFIRAAEANSQTSTIDFLAELFDNSIDAGATVVDAEVKGERKNSGHGSFHIADNGCGVANIKQLLAIGESDKPGGEDSIGRHGVGAKDCIYSVGGLSSTLDIESVTDACAWSISILWQQQHDWTFEQQECDAADLDMIGKTGLRLSIARAHRRMPPSSELRARLSRIYWPWLLRAGNRMTVNGEQVQAPSLPETDRRLREKRVEFDGGRSLTIDGGILKGDSDLAGVTVLHGNRAVYITNAIGLGDHARSGVFFLVNLRGPWGLGRNKMGMTEDHEDELRERLEVELAQIMAEADQRMMEMDAGNLLEGLNDQFAGMQFATGTAARPGQGTGGQRNGDGPGTRNKPVEAEHIKEGVDGTKKRGGRVASKTKPFRIEMVVGQDAESVGSVDIRSRRVYLHKNNSAVAKLHEERERMALLAISAMLVVYRIEQDRTKGQLPFERQTGAMLSAALEGRAAELAGKK